MTTTPQQRKILKADKIIVRMAADGYTPRHIANRLLWFSPLSDSLQQVTDIVTLERLITDYTTEETFVPLLGEVLGYTPAILDDMTGRDAAGYFETLDGVRMCYMDIPTVENSENGEPTNAEESAIETLHAIAKVGQKINPQDRGLAHCRLYTTAPANGKSVLSLDRVAEMATEGGFDFDECREAAYERMAANSFPSLKSWRRAKARELRREAAEQWRGEIDAERQLFRAAYGIPTAENFTF